MRNALPAGLVSVALICSSLSVFGAPSGQWLFRETFDNYTEQLPPQFTQTGDGTMKLSEHPPVLSKSLLCKPEAGKSFMVYKDFDRKTREAVWTNLDFELSFAFADAAAMEFAVPIQFDKRNLAATVEFRVDGISLNMKGRVAGKSFADLGIPAFVPNNTYTVTFRIADDSITVFLLDRGDLVRIAQGELPRGAAVSGFNFNIKSPVRLYEYALTAIDPAKKLSYRDSSTMPVFATGQPAPKQPQAASPRRQFDIPLAKGDDCVKARVRFGKDPAPKALRLIWDDGKDSSIDVRAFDQQMGFAIVADGKVTNKTVALPDAGIAFSLPKVASRNYFVRPNPAFYTDAQRRDLQKRYAQFPAASETFLDMEFRADAGGANIFLNDNCIMRVASTSALAKIVFSLPESADLYSAVTSRHIEDPSYYPLSTRHVGGESVMKNGRLQLRESVAGAVSGIPFASTDPAYAIDVGRSKVMSGHEFTSNRHLTRTPFEGMPESILFIAPQDYYHKAYVLCALDPDPAKDPVITARIVRFGDIGDAALATSTVEIPRTGKLPPNVRQAGTVKYTTAEGTTNQVPVYLVEIELPIGKILDVLQNEEYQRGKDAAGLGRMGYRHLDFELTGKMDGLYQQCDMRWAPDPRSVSAVQVFGVTLAKAPASFRVRQLVHANAFANDEKPQTAVSVAAARDGKYTFRWDILAVDGQVLKSESRDFEMKAGDSQELTLDLTMPKLGWYGLKYSLLDGPQRIMDHDASFVLLGADTRRAAYDSPYGTWWFRGSHYTTKDPEVICPLMMKAGFRKITLDTGHTEEMLKPWKLTVSQIGDCLSSLPDISRKDQYTEAQLKTFRRLEESIKAFPHCKEIMIFHESFPTMTPAEIYGGAVPTDEASLKRQKTVTEKATWVARYLRATYPDYKICMGNSSIPAMGLAMVLREGFDTSLFDQIGTEAASQSIMPEKLSDVGVAGAWFVRETARAFGKEVKVSGALEFIYRCDRDLGQRRLAEWYARDILLCHANDFTLICPGQIEDIGGPYFNTIWGQNGFLQRGPFLYPKPAYAAVATATRVLDQVKFLRRVPTGSLTAYALEFQRSDGKTVYAFWTCRGEGNMRFQFPENDALEVVNFFGDSETPKGNDVTLAFSESPRYIVASRPVQAVSVLNRSYPADTARAKELKVSAAMDSADGWTLDPSRRLAELTERNYFPYHRASEQFIMRTAQDETMGDCIELELTGTAPFKPMPGNQLKSYDALSEYTVMQPKQPAEIKGKPRSLGVWVKGNSNWGNIIFEVTDAEGEVWRSQGTGGYGCSILDWEGRTSVNFDGWTLVKMPLTEDSPDRIANPGNVMGQWVTNGKGNGIMDYPLTFTGIIPVMYRKALDLKEMAPVTPVLRFKNAGALD